MNLLLYVLSLTFTLRIWIFPAGWPFHPELLSENLKCWNLLFNSLRFIGNLKYVLYLTAYKTHPNFSRANQEKNQSTNIKHDEINIMNIINGNIFNLHYSLLNNDYR